MSLASALQAYRTLRPTDWVATYESLPTWAGILTLALGVLLLLYGGGRFFRGVAGPLGFLLGILWVPVILQRLGVSRMPPALLPIGLALLGFAFPPGGVFFAVGLPLGLAAGELAGGSDWALGFVPGTLAGGAIGLLLHRYLAAFVASVVGGWLVVLGLLSAFQNVGSISATLAAQPVGVLVGAGLLAASGTVYQLLVRPSPEEAARRAAEKAQKRRRLEEKQALEKRWANYSSERRRP